MIKPLIAGNWKMNLTIDEGISLVNELKDLIKDIDDVEVAVAPSFTSLSDIKRVLKGSTIKLAAQNVFWEKSGAYTGEISPQMLKTLGCDYVIIGHSERRCIFKETDDMVNKKVFAALEVGLNPILCVGETLEQRKKDGPLKIVERQIIMALEGILPGQIKDVVIAYEPVWAIGTGETASPEQVEEVHCFIKGYIFDTFGWEEGRGCRVIYGGSVKPENIDGLMAQPNIDGALVGGASLKVKDFARIVRFKHSHYKLKNQS